MRESEIRSRKSEAGNRKKFPASDFRLPTSEYDVIIVGGGLAGLTLACRLGAAGARLLCLDREPAATRTTAAFDGRTTAISFGSRQIMESAGVWDRVAADASPIDRIDILDGGSPVLLSFGKAEVGGRSFGWIVENRLLRLALLARLRQLKTATHLAPATVVDFSRNEHSATARLADGREFSAALIIGADGRASATREWLGIGARQWAYDQRAIVCAVTHEQTHSQVAVEHFHPSGPFAILPMTDAPDGAHRSSVVWTEHGPARRSALTYDQASFDAALTARFPARYGAVRQLGGRFSYPLGLLHAHDYIAPRFALIAEAAHAIHPIAGQGLNIGLRDVAALAELVVEALQTGDDPGAAVLLERYQRRRRRDVMRMAAATDGLNRLFATNRLSLKLARRAGVRAVARLPAAKQFFMRQAMGLAGV